MTGSDDGLNESQGQEMPQYQAASTRKWLASGGFQHHQIFWAGPLRRKKSHRRLGLLDEQIKREPNPIAATTHVRVIEIPEPLADVVEHVDSEDTSVRDDVAHDGDDRSTGRRLPRPSRTA